MNRSILIKVLTAESELDFSLPSSATGENLYNLMYKRLKLRETWYFGLLFEDSKGVPTWLIHNQRILSQDIGKPSIIQFKFRIKYFPEEVEKELLQSVTKRLFYSQIYKDILEGSIYCSAETCILLSSIACQCKYGDFQEEFLKNSNSFLYKEKLLPDRIIEQHKITKKKWIELIVEMYKKHKYMMNDDAIMEYLKVAQDLEMFGVNYFKVKNENGSDLLLGVDALGLNIYNPGNKLIPTIGFLWSEIKYINYSKRKFIIKSTDKNSSTFVLFTDCRRISKAIFQVSMGNQDWYLKRRRADSAEIQQIKSYVEENKEDIQKYKSKITEERTAREESDAKLLEMETKLKESNELNENIQQKIEEHAKQIKELEEMLRQFKLHEEELQKLSENNQALQYAKVKLREKNAKLLKEKEIIQNEIRQKNNEIKHASEELECLRKEKVRKSFTDDRREEDRHTYLSTKTELQNILNSLSQFLRKECDPSKLEAIDCIFRENEATGFDKYKTLKQIRRGNTRKRIDQFEALKQD